MKSMPGIHAGASPGDATARSPTRRSSGRPGRAGLAAALLLTLATGVALALHGAARPKVPAAATAASTAPDFLDNLDGLQLIDQNGHALRRAGLAGKIVLLNFVFTGCAATCPTQTRELAALQQALPAPVRRDVRFVSISVDPLGDTPALLRAYGRSAGADFSSWTFATGRPQDIERLGERLRLFRGGAAPVRPEDHATGLWLADGSGRLMQRYSGPGVDVARLTGELTRLRDLAAEARRTP
jgi:protein SCO1/2